MSTVACNPPVDPRDDEPGLRGPLIQLVVTALLFLIYWLCLRGCNEPARAPEIDVIPPSRTLALIVA